MHLSYLLLPPILLITPIQAIPRFSVPSGSGIANSARPHESTKCSANQSGAIPDWAANPAWQESMKTCLQDMSGDGWDGVECKPAANGTTLGPSFKFWKGERKWDDGGSACYGECSSCLLDGIQWNQAQTTNCQYEYYTGAGVTRHHCQMGFDYGDWP